ncbi:MAG: hypothetical protein LH616_12750, partial [Ilumatobacteraceae bacterium]|nr:hypothetical protein [Ilumatobacteraceae bacterium]
DAVTALLALGQAHDGVDGRAVNIGRGTGHTLHDLAQLMLTAVGHGVIRNLPASGPGRTNVVTDIALLRSLVDMWEPAPLASSLAETVRWYRGGSDAP